MNKENVRKHIAFIHNMAKDYGLLDNEEILRTHEVMNYIDCLEQENQQLKEKLNCDLQWAFKYEKQVDNWNKLKGWVNRYYDYYMNNEDFTGGRLCFTDMQNKMQELERGVSDVG